MVSSPEETAGELGSRGQQVAWDAQSGLGSQGRTRWQPERGHGEAQEWEKAKENQDGQTGELGSRAQGGQRRPLTPSQRAASSHPQAGWSLWADPAVRSSRS